MQGQATKSISAPIGGADVPLVRADKGASWLESLAPLTANQLTKVRRSLYHSEGTGVVVFKEFLPASHLAHMRSLWGEELLAMDGRKIFAQQAFKKFVTKKDFRTGCKNFFLQQPSPNKISNFYNFFWNKPVDEVAHQASMWVTLLRNQVEGRPLYRELHPLDGNAVSYRVIRTQEADQTVEPHKDWVGAAHFDPRRLQATLLLSDHGCDWNGEGFRVRNNAGTWTCPAADGIAGAGDLILWRYNNEHAVGPVRPGPTGLGFLRVIYPPEFIHPRNRTQAFMDRAVQRGRSSAGKVLRRLGWRRV